MTVVIMVVMSAVDSNDNDSGGDGDGGGSYLDCNVATMIMAWRVICS